MDEGDLPVRHESSQNWDDGGFIEGISFFQHDILVNDEKMTEFEEDLIQQFAKLRRTAPSKAKYLLVTLAGLVARGSGSKLQGVQQIAGKLQDIFQTYQSLLRGQEQQVDTATRKWINKFWRRVRNHSRCLLNKSRRNNKNAMVQPPAKNAEKVAKQTVPPAGDADVTCMESDETGSGTGQAPREQDRLEDQVSLMQVPAGLNWVQALQLEIERQENWHPGGESCVSTQS